MVSTGMLCYERPGHVLCTDDPAQLAVDLEGSSQEDDEEEEDQEGPPQRSDAPEARDSGALRSPTKPLKVRVPVPAVLRLQVCGVCTSARPAQRRPPSQRGMRHLVHGSQGDGGHGVCRPLRTALRCSGHRAGARGAQLSSRSE